MNNEKKFYVNKSISFENNNFQKILEMCKEKNIKISQALNMIVNSYFKDDLIICPNCNAKFSKKIIKKGFENE